MLKMFFVRLGAAALGIALISGCTTSKSPQAALPPLSETITSFGAVTAGDWLYVFGGHKGERHDYSMEMVSGSFERLNLADGKAWEKLPASTPGQGLALVAHGPYLYRIGGMAAHNHDGEKQDLYSIAVVQRFDTKTRRWEEMTPLPSIRSSHDAAIIGNKLYIAGGWGLGGGTNKAMWHSNALVMDLSAPEKGWTTFAQPFSRRALALATVGSRIFCIGGMSSDNEPSNAVDIYDTATGLWAKGPDLPSSKYKGFSCSAIAQNGRVYVTTYKGELWRLVADGRSWETVGKMDHPRLAHRLVTAGSRQLIALGGENGSQEKTPDLEVLTPASKPINATQSTAKN